MNPNHFSLSGKVPAPQVPAPELLHDTRPSLPSAALLQEHPGMLMDNMHAAELAHEHERPSTPTDHTCGKHEGMLMPLNSKTSTDPLGCSDCGHH